MAEELLSNTALQGESDVVISGSCLYGAIKYTILGTPHTTVLYHCISCKKSCGSSFQANGIYDPSVRDFSVHNFISCPSPVAFMQKK
jgi:hypothetical protein